MKARVWVMLVAIMLIGAVSQATIIGFRNADFEADAAAAVAAGWTTTITDWYGGSGCLAPNAASDGAFAWTNGGGYLAQGNVEDELGSQLTLGVDNTFDLTFDVASQLADYVTDVYIEIWSAGLFVGTSEAIDVSAATPDGFVTTNVVFSINGNTVQVSETYDIALRNVAGQLWTDNWSGTVESVVPEPATMVLLGLGGLLLGRRK